MEKAKNSKRLWTKQQEEFLVESYGVAGIQFLMDRLGKSENAIIDKIKQLTGSHNIREAIGTFSSREIAEALGVNHRTIVDWIDKKGFPGKQLYKKRNDTKRRIYTIDPNHVWKWVEKNKERINFSHVKTGILLPEPIWLEEEIRKANQQIIKRPKNWTKEEDAAALFWHDTGMHYKEIARRLNRPEKGTWARINRLIKKRMEKKKI